MTPSTGPSGPGNHSGSPAPKPDDKRPDPPSLAEDDPGQRPGDAPADAPTTDTAAP